MRTSRTFVLLVGVTLSVAPIFSSVSAQQNDGQNFQANMLLEIQALRAEIAELRDMVERQQYQLRRMQQGQQRQQQGPGAQQAQSARNAYQQPQTPQYGQPQTGPVPAYQDQATGGQTSTESNVSGGPVVAAQSAQAGNPITDPANPVATAPEASATLPEDDIAPAFVENNRDFYQPYTPSDDSVTDTSTASAADYANSQNTVIVDERVLNPSTPYPGIQQGASYPPVVDRSVGTQPAGPAVVAPSPAAADAQPGNPEALSYPTNNQGQPVQASTPVGDSVNSVQPGTVQAAPNDSYQTNSSSAAGQVAAAPGAVIAIPGAVAATTAPAAAGTAGVSGSQSPAPNNQQAAVSGVQPGFNQAPAPSPAPVVLSEQDYYQQGFNLLKQSRHDQAVDMFKQQISNYPQGSYADDAHYWIAESKYVNRALDESKLYFRAIISNFAQSPRMPDAMLKTAYIEQEQGNEIEARILLQEIIQYHPRSNAAISAKNRLAELD
ncbi:MAG: tol-pal system protein YbgF [Pseudomonadota bacterium]